MTTPHETLEAARARLPEALAMLQRLVEIPSGTTEGSGVTAVQEALAERLRGLGFQVTLWTEASEHAFGPHLLARSPLTTGPRLVLIGHADTAHRFDHDDPFTWSTDGTRARGPGVADMKGGLVVALEALELLHAEAGALPRVDVLITPDEELGSPVSRTVFPRVVLGAEAVLSVEPARPDGSVVTSRKGSAHLRVRASGRAAHAGIALHEGANAIEALARFVVDAQGRSDRARDVTVNVGTISGGSATNVVPASAHATVHVGAWTRADLEDVLATIRDAARRPGVTGTRLDVDGGVSFPPMERSPAVARLVAVAHAEAEALGFVLHETATGGAGDAGHVADLGVSVLCGLGPVGGGLHGRDEYLEVESLATRAALMARLVARLGATS